MQKLGKDCNGDNVITCEDHILIHRYGATGCLTYKNHTDGGSKLLEHQLCLNAMIVSRHVTYRNHQQGYHGFRLNFLDPRGHYSERDVRPKHGFHSQRNCGP